MERGDDQLQRSFGVARGGLCCEGEVRSLASVVQASKGSETNIPRPLVFMRPAERVAIHLIAEYTLG